MGAEKWVRCSMVWLFVPGLIVSVSPVAAQPQEPMLTLETGMHIARVLRFAVDRSDRFMVTVGEDKTARIWDISKGNGPVLKRVLRPPIAPGHEGKLLAVAISPDGRTIACGGYTGLEWDRRSAIYLFDRETGEMTRRIEGLDRRVCHLAYSPDGRFLAASFSAPGGVVVFRMPDCSLVGIDEDYVGDTPWVEFDNRTAFMVTSCFDGQVRLYESASLSGNYSGSGRISPVFRFDFGQAIKPCTATFSPDGSMVAVGFFDRPKVSVLALRERRLSHAFSPDTIGVEATGRLWAVAWSSDGRSIYAAGFHRIRGQQIRKWSNSGRGAYVDLPCGNAPVPQLSARDAGGVFFCGLLYPFVGAYDADDRIIFWKKPDMADNRRVSEEFRISSDGWVVQFSYEFGGQALAVFSVPERSLREISSSLFGGIKVAFTMSAPRTRGLDVSDWGDYSKSPKLGKTPIPIQEGESSISLAIDPAESSFVLGTDRSVYLFDRTGRLAWNVQAPGETWALNTNGKVVVAAHGDGTIRWYRFSDGKELLALFPHADRKRWVLWTPSGHYEASPGAEDLIGWHLNRGKDRQAEFFPASRFRAVYARSDVIDKVVATLDPAEGVRLANLESGRKEDVRLSIREMLPPTVKILSPTDGTEVASADVTVRYTVQSQAPLTRLRVLLDGRPVTPQGGVKESPEGGEFVVSIPPRDTELSIVAENRHAASEPATVRLRWKGQPPREVFEIKPKLYVLAVGVSSYEDPGLRLDFAAKDAKDFGASWLGQVGLLYSHVEVKTLTDAQATKGNILDGLDWLQRQTTSKDVAMIFLAGHGVTDQSGVFYFLPVEGDLERLKRTGVSQADITTTVASIAGKVIVFVDACHSGKVMEKVKRRSALDLNAVVNELASAENGAIVFSSATGRQYSLESGEWGNGAFAKALVEGIGGKADFRGTGRITVNMLDLYVSERVKELTKGEQTPCTVKPPNVPDFPVVVVRKVLSSS